MAMIDNQSTFLRCLSDKRTSLYFLSISGVETRSYMTLTPDRVWKSHRGCRSKCPRGTSAWPSTVCRRRRAGGG